MTLEEEWEKKLNRGDIVDNLNMWWTEMEGNVNAYSEELKRNEKEEKWEWVEVKGDRLRFGFAVKEWRDRWKSWWRGL